MIALQFSFYDFITCLNHAESIKTLPKSLYLSRNVGLFGSFQLDHWSANITRWVSTVLSVCVDSICGLAAGCASPACRDLFNYVRMQVDTCSVQYLQSYLEVHMRRNLNWIKRWTKLSVLKNALTKWGLKQANEVRTWVFIVLLGLRQHLWCSATKCMKY